jgi:hypothetical protein
MKAPPPVALIDGGMGRLSVNFDRPCDRARADSANLRIAGNPAKVPTAPLPASFRKLLLFNCFLFLMGDLQKM